MALLMKVVVALLATVAHTAKFTTVAQPRVRHLMQPSVCHTAQSSVRRVTHPLMASLPATLAVASTIPTLAGYWKTEYGVSYAYGAAMAACGILMLPATSSVIAKAHSLVLVLYGVRLNLFLLYRELAIPRFREMREKIEARTKKQGGRLKRTPFVLGCSLLYYCMAAPLVVTAAAATGPMATTGSLQVLLKIEVALMYLGFATAAIGDAQKTYMKAKNGEDSLVTKGIYSFLRHPNYTGELLLWTASAAAALTAAPLALTSGSMPAFALASWLVASAVGLAGIGFVLVRAATGLEAKQKDKYGVPDGVGGGPYEKWVANSWAGPTL